MRHQLTLVLLLAVLTAAAAAESGRLQPPYSWRGIDGQGVFPAGDLVTEFCDVPEDADLSGYKRKPAAKPGTRKNIVWRTLLPHWGHNSPVVMGDRVYLLCEEGWKSDAPELVCVSTVDGEIRWQHPVDHLDAWPERPDATHQVGREEAQRMRALELERWRTNMRLWNRLYWDNERNAPVKPERSTYEAVVAEMGEQGWSLPPYEKVRAPGGPNDMGNTAYRGRDRVKAAPEALRENHAAVHEYRIYWRPGWTTEGPFYGTTMGSVVGDGDRIYAVTAFGGATAYTPAGERVWVQDLGVRHARIAEPDKKGRKRTYTHTSWTGPALGAGHLVFFSCTSMTMYGVAVVDGRLAWTTVSPMNGKKGWGGGIGYGPNGTPVIMKIPDAAGRKHAVAVASHGMAVRIADGALLGFVPPIHAAAGDPPVDYQTQLSWTARDDVLFVYNEKNAAGKLGGSTGAFRLAIAGDALNCERLWIGEVAKRQCNLTLLGDAVLIGGAAMDAATGNMRPGRWPRGGYFCGMPTTGTVVIGGGGGKRNEALRGTYQMVSFPDAKQMGGGVLIAPRPTGEVAERHIAHMGGEIIYWGAGMTAVPWGNRIFIRSNDYLWCVGDPKATWVPPEHYLR